MARIYLSPLIVDIRNKQKDTVFSKWKGINYIRSRVVPSNPKTAAQVAVRESLRGLVLCWQEGYPTLKLNWDEYVSGRNYSGFNDFIGKNVIKNRDAELLILTQEVGFDKILTFEAGSTMEPTEVDIIFTPTPVDTGRSMSVYVREPGEEGWTKKEQLAAAETSPYTITGLVADTLYEVYAYLELAVSPTGTDVGKDMSDTVTTS